jgi:hypothetical protein
VGIARAALVLNGYLQPVFSPEERRRLQLAPAALEPVAHAALAREGRAELSQRYARKLAVDIALPQIQVPFLYAENFGRPAVEEISRILERA